MLCNAESADAAEILGMQRISIDRVVTVMPSDATPPYGSDHAGDIAVFRP
jgi:hypothetical protein